MEAKDLITNEYLPFAKSSIIDRSITYIDGLKPVQRRILYAMYELGLLKDTNMTKKAARIVGDTMGKYHPHGDKSIYEAACAMADSYEGNNAAFIKGRGNLGKKWSNPKLGGLHAAHMRYSELGFAPIAKELFGGLKDDAVDFIPNFDNSEKEPALLPVSFPNCITNMNKGIAVGLGSCMPSYTIENVCNAVAGYIDGSLATDEEVAEALGVPDFPGECRIHSDKDLLIKLYKTGKATFRCSSTYHLSGREIIIDSIPPSTTFEAVMKQIRDFALTNDGRDIVDITSNVGKNTKGIRIQVRPSADIKLVLANLYAKTKMLDTISFYSRIIWKGLPQDYSVKKVIDCWIEFRDTCLTRTYNHSLAGKKETEHKLSVWDKIKDDLAKVVQILSTMSEDDATAKLKEEYGFDDIQCEYLLSMQIRSICTDKAKKALERLAELRKDIKFLEDLIGSKESRLGVIVNELRMIAKNYATPRRSVVDGIIKTATKKEKKQIPDTMTTIFITSRGFVKTVDGMQMPDAMDKQLSANDSLLVTPVYARKNEYLLVYTYSGYCYKILVNDIENSRGAFKQYLWELVERKDDSPLLYATASHEYKERFVIIYGNGSGKVVSTSKVSGRQKIYKGQFPAGTQQLGHQNTLFMLPYAKFVLYTKRRKAAIGTLEYLFKYGQQSNGRIAFKVTRITPDDALVGILNASNLDAYVDKGYIDVSKYQKGYPVAFKNDPITYLDKPIEEFEAAWQAFLQSQNNNQAG